MKRKLHLDYETRSTCDLRTEGVYRYVENPTTEIILASYLIDAGSIKRWMPIWGELPPADLIEALEDPECIICGHNSVGFEHKITVITGRKYFSKSTIAAVKPYKRWSCTAVRSAACGLPRDLDGSSVALRIKEKKDKIGSALMLTMCKPIRYDEYMRPIWKEDPESVRRLAEYCDADVAVEVAIDNKLPELSEWETRIWHACERMNDRGIMLDGPLVNRMAEFVVEAEVAVNAKINRITKGRVPKVTNIAKLKAWLADNEVEVDNLGKNTLKDLLNAHKKYEEELEKLGLETGLLDEHILDSALPAPVKEVLLLRQSGGKSSAGKYKSALARMNKDSRARGAMRYCGAASTSRFSSTGLQLQNLVRGSGIETYNKVEKKIKRALDIEAAIQSIIDGASVTDIERDYGPALIVASDLVRPSFVAKPGYCIARGDYSQIEARVSCLVGNQSDSLKAYEDFDTILGYKEDGKPIRKGKDLYLLNAANVLSILEGSLRDPDSIADNERQIYGKVSDLSGGFGGSTGAYLAFARLYGVHVSDADALQIVKGYRAANKGKVAAWYVFERAAERCIRGLPGEKYWACTETGDEDILNFDGTPRIGNVVIKPLAYFKRDARRMIMKMPCGGQIIYWYPRMEKRMMPWGREKEVIVYYAQDSQKKIWRQFSAYGGLLFQNFVQRYARDVAADALVLMDDRGLNPIMMVHDENLAEIAMHKCDNDYKVAAKMVSDAMLVRRSWIDPALPIAVEASAGPRYVKG